MKKIGDLFENGNRLLNGQVCILLGYGFCLLSRSKEEGQDNCLTGGIRRRPCCRFILHKLQGQFALGKTKGDGEGDGPLNIG